jgi:hypothetical protein
MVIHYPTHDKLNSWQTRAEGGTQDRQDLLADIEEGLGEHDPGLRPDMLHPFQTGSEHCLRHLRNCKNQQMH